MPSWKLGIGGIAIALAIGFASWQLYRLPVPQPSDTSLAPRPILAEQEAEEAIVIEDMVMGREDAPIILVEYASYTCPHCGNFHQNVFKDLKRDYIDTGKVHFIYREVYYDRYGLWAAMVARCGGKQRYFAIQDMLYRRIADWANSEDPNVAIGKIKEIGLAAGLSKGDLDICLQNEDNAKAMIEYYRQTSEKDDVKGTPTLFINGKKYSNMPYKRLKTILDAELSDL